MKQITRTKQEDKIKDTTTLFKPVSASVPSGTALITNIAFSTNKVQIDPVDCRSPRNSRSEIPAVPEEAEKESGCVWYNPCSWGK